MEEHLLVKIAYATASLRAGTRMDKEALAAARVCINGIDELTVVLGKWTEEHIKVSEDGSSGNKDNAPMVVTPVKPFQAANSWRFTVYKANKKTGTASWELSYDHFAAKGKPRQTIAMTQSSGKPIQLATVLGHIYDGLVQCRLVDLHRLSLADPPPTKGEWQDHERCCVDTAIDKTNYLILMIQNNYEKRF